jgi:hypothetical protein
MRIDLGSGSLPWMDLPADVKAEALKLAAETRGARALRGVCRVTCGMFAVEEPVR